MCVRVYVCVCVFYVCNNVFVFDGLCSLLFCLFVCLFGFFNFLFSLNRKHFTATLYVLSSFFKQIVAARWGFGRNFLLVSIFQSIVLLIVHVFEKSKLGETRWKNVRGKMEKLSGFKKMKYSN